MAKTVYSSGGLLYTDDGQLLTGAGQELGFAELTTNFLTASTSYVDVTGMSLSFTVPASPYMLVAQAAIVTEESGAVSSLRMITGSTQIFNGDVRAAVANDSKSIQIFARFPCSFHAPAVGSTQTYKLQLKTSVATSDATMLVDFIGVKAITYLQAYTLR